jgi:hypothetical protein
VCDSRTMRGVVTWARTAGVAAALIVGCVGSAAAVRLSDFPGPPAEATAVAAAVTAIGQQPADTPGPVVVCDFWCPEPGGDAVVAYDSPPDRTDVVAVAYDLPGTAAAAVEAAARTRLAAQGWRVAGEDFVRDGSVVDLQIADTVGGVRAVVVMSKDSSSAAVGLAAAGFVAGAVLGWLLAGATERRFRRHGPAVSLVAGTLTVLVTAVTFGYATLTVLFVAHGGPQQPGVQLAEFLLTVMPSLTRAMAVAVVVALLLIALPPRRGGTPRPGRPIVGAGEADAGRTG